MRTLTLMASLLALSTLASADFSPSLQLDRRGLYENQHMPGDKTDWGQSTDFYLIPAFSWGQSALLPVIVDLEQGRGVDEQIGLVTNDTFFVRRTTYLFKPIYRYQAKPDLGLKLWGVAKRTVNAEKDDTVPYKGLYDYEEFGVGTGFDRKTDGAIASWGLGLEYQHRHYPNWKDPGVSLTQSKNYYTKDYNGLKASLDLKGRRDSSTPWTLALSWLGRGYTDSYLYDVASDGAVLGSITPDKSSLRMESLLRFNADASHALTERWSLAANAGVDWNASNFNYFDTDPQYYVGYSDYYSYHSTHGSLALAWSPAPDSTVLNFKAELTNRVYTGRPIRNSTGTYAMGTQADLEQEYSFDFDQPLGKGFSLVGGMDWLNVLSNQAFATGVANAYDLFSSTLGLKYKL